MSFTPSPVVAEINRQLNALGVLGGTRLVQMDDNTLRVSKTRGRKTRNVDIAYNPGHDLYDVTIHEMVWPTIAEIGAGKGTAIASRTVTMVYADQLDDAVRTWKAA